MRIILSSILGTIIVLLLVGAPDIAFGRGTGPVEPPGPADVVPDPSECQVEPRTADEMRDFNVLANAYAPEREGGRRLVEELPTGDPADQETVDEITAVMNEMAACVNAGDPLRAYALISEDVFIANPINRDTLEEGLAGTPQPLEQEESVWIDEISDVIVLEDGRVAALVTIGGVEDPHPAQGRTSIYVFIEEDGRWLIDDTIERIVVVDGNREVVLYVADAVATPEAERATPEPSAAD